MRLRNANDLNCAILMAGMAAEVVVLGYSERECGRTDLYQARNILRSNCSDDRLIEARLDRELNQTIALLESHRDVLLALAREIIHKRFLTGGDVSRIITKASAGVH
jgi:ATP-dependent Zn protease